MNNMIDLRSYPHGGYGIVLLNDRRQNVQGHLSAMLMPGNIASIVGHVESGDVGKTFEDATIPLIIKSLSMDVQGGNICLKLFPECTDTHCVSEYELFSRLKEALQDNFDKYTLYNPLSVADSIEKYSLFTVNLKQSIVIKTTNKDVATKTILFMPLKVCEQNISSGDITLNHIEQLKQEVKYLNYHGVFHTDIKKENIMICGDIARLIDLGSVKIDDGTMMTIGKYDEVMKSPSTEMEGKKIYSPKMVASPFVRLFFTKILDKSMIRHNLYNQLLNSYNMVNLEKFLMSKRNDELFLRYMLHKEDCFTLVTSLYTLGLKQGGGFLKNCFRPKVKEPSNVDIDLSYRDKLPYASIFHELLYLDQEDFNTFKENYTPPDKNSTVYQCNLTGGKRKPSGRKPSTKAYVQMKSGTRKYVVRQDDHKHKYIQMNKEQVSLSSIRGKYMYC